MGVEIQTEVEAETEAATGFGRRIPDREESVEKFSAILRPGIPASTSDDDLAAAIKGAFGKAGDEMSEAVPTILKKIVPYEHIYFGAFFSFPLVLMLVDFRRLWKWIWS